MRKLKLQTQVSVDGFIAGPNGEMDWMTWNMDDALKNYIGELTKPVDTILLGRVLAEGFIPTWASLAQNPDAEWFHHKMVDTPKIVFSRSMQSSEWANTTLVNDDLAATITQLKNEPGGDIIAYGGARFVSSLIQHNLIDEYHLFINPAVLGDGLPIFKTIEQRLKLQLVQAQGFECGIAVLCYQPAQ